MPLTSALKREFIFFLFLFLSSFVFAQKTKVSSKNIVHQLMLNDSELWGDNSAEIKLCDSFMQRAAARIKRLYTKRQIRNADTGIAINVLKAIDSTFTEFNFLFSTDLSVHFDFLTPAFRDTGFNGQYYKHKFATNIYRKNYWKDKTKTHCRLIDCDIYSELYLGIAQMTGLPLHMVELPQHIFIRWVFPDGKYLNWDTIEGVEFSNGSENSYWSLNDGNRHLYLYNWTLRQVKANYYSLFAMCYDYYYPEHIDKKKAKVWYEKCLALWPGWGVELHEYVRLYLNSPGLFNKSDQPKMFAYIDMAIEQEKRLSYFDAKACLYAAMQNWDEAIRWEEKAVALANDPNYDHDKAKKHLEEFIEKKRLATSKVGQQINYKVLK